MRKIIDRYLGTIVLQYFGFAVLAIYGLFVIIDLFNNLDEYVDANDEFMLREMVLGYVYNFSPLVYAVAPLIFCLSCLFAISRLHQNSQLIALMSSGVSLHRLARTLLWMSLLIGAVLFAMGEFAIPWSLKGQLRLDKQLDDGRVISSSFRDQLSLPKDFFPELFDFPRTYDLVRIEGMHVDDKSADRLHVMIFDQKQRPRLVFEAYDVEWINDSEATVSKGILFPCYFDNVPQNIEKNNFTNIKIQLNVPFDSAAYASIDSNILNIKDLYYFLHNPAFKVAYLFRLYQPFYSLLMLMLCFCISLGLLLKKPVYGYLSALIICLVFFAVTEQIKQLIEVGDLDPMISMMSMIVFVPLLYVLRRKSMSS